MFYEKFYQEQNKADKIRMLEYVSEKIKNVIVQSEKEKIDGKRRRMKMEQIKE